MAKLRIETETVPNENVLVFHVNRKLTVHAIHMFLSKPQENKENLPSNIFSLVEEIFDIEGVTGDLFVSPYQISVHKGHLFQWDDIELKVKAVMAKFLTNPEKASFQTSNKN